MPKYISFFCATPPKKGTGQTLIGNTKLITEVLHTNLPTLSKKLSETDLTYTARYLPQKEWRTAWIRWFNPSHGTIKGRFGTEDRKEVEEICKETGFTCIWEGSWALISHSASATIKVECNTLFCNQMHVDKLSPVLCGGWVNYYFARLLLYPTPNWNQFDVKFEDGTEISPHETGQILKIFEKYEIKLEWEKGDLLILDNVMTMHGKLPHSGSREILVAMSGSVEEK